MKMAQGAMLFMAAAAVAENSTFPTVWVISLCVSVLLNLILAWRLIRVSGVSVGARMKKWLSKLRRRKKKQVDDVPLVDYDIDEDIL